MTKHLGIDYGTKKVGIATSDDSGAMAFPREVVPNDGRLYTTIQKILEEENIKDVVIGHSIAMDGSENPLMQGVYAFKDALEDDGYVVFLEPEFLTTFQAKRNTDDALADAAAAAIILQSFLDKEH